MQISLIRAPSILLVGVVLHVFLVLALYTISEAAVPTSQTPWPLWYSALVGPSRAIVSLAPGLLVGWLAGRSGLVMGALVGALSAVAESILVPIIYSMPLTAAQFSLSFISAVAAYVIYGAVAGLAGQVLRTTRVTPNNSFKRTADVGLR